MHARFLSFLLFSALPASRAAAEATEKAGAVSPSGDGSRAPEPKVVVHETSTRHIVGLRFDMGSRGTDYGLGYLVGDQSTEASGGLGVTLWLALGLDLRGVTQEHENIDALLAYGVGRFSFMGDAGGLGFEVAAGGGTGHGETRASGALGVFWSALYVDLGYSFQFPLDMGERPSWLSGHQFSARINIPVATRNVSRW